MAEFQVVKYKAGKLTFEVLTKPGAVLKYRQKTLGSLDNVLFADDIFKNHNKGERASTEELKATFGTDKVSDVLKQIVEKGDIELSAAERKEAVEKKRAEIVNYIHKYYIDPKSKTPHPVVRIQNALDQLKIRVDPDIPADRQVQEITRRLPEVLAVRRTEMEGTITIPHAYLGQAAGVIKKFAQVKGESYGGEGCAYEVSFVPGDYQPLTQELQKLTQGDFQFEVQGQDLAASQEPDAKGGKGKKGGAGAKRTPGKK